MRAVAPSEGAEAPALPTHLHMAELPPRVVAREEEAAVMPLPLLGHSDLHPQRHWPGRHPDVDRMVVEVAVVDDTTRPTWRLRYSLTPSVVGP